MTRIIAHYFPRDFDVGSMLVAHLDRDACILVAESGYKIIGFSVNSCHFRKTPFYEKDLPLFYQRLLYVDPVVQHKAIGLGLQTAGLRYQMGPFWLFRRFAVVCLTSNPQVLRAISQYSEYYPRQDDVLPEEVYAFCQQLGPMLGFSRVDRRLLVYGTNETILEGEDYTSDWNRFLRSDYAGYDRMVLNSALTTRDGKIIHTGALLIAIGYARPMHFIRRFVEVFFRYHH